jgi:alpha 1,3-glucosidase
LPIRERVRRSSPLMWQDPFTLVIALSKEGTASGELYLDDGVGYSHLSGEFIWRDFSIDKGVLRSTDKARSNARELGETFDLAGYEPEGNAWAVKVGHVRLEKIVILGMKSRPHKGVMSRGVAMDWEWEAGVQCNGRKEGVASRLTVKNPELKIVGDWELVFA